MQKTICDPEGLSSPATSVIGQTSCKLNYHTMFSRIQTRNFRCLKAIDQELGAFQALVGPNASGKTTFLDVISLISDLMRNRGDVPETLRVRSANFADLVWMGQGDVFQLAVEAPIPPEVSQQMAIEKQAFDLVRYELEIGLLADANEIGISHETLWLKRESEKSIEPQRELFPAVSADMPSIFAKSGKSMRAVITKKTDGNNNYYPEGRKSYSPSFRLGRKMDMGKAGNGMARHAVHISGQFPGLNMSNGNIQVSANNCRNKLFTPVAGQEDYIRRSILKNVCKG